MNHEQRFMERIKSPNFLNGFERQESQLFEQQAGGSASVNAVHVAFMQERELLRVEMERLDERYRAGKLQAMDYWPYRQLTQRPYYSPFWFEQILEMNWRRARLIQMDLYSFRKVSSRPRPSLDS